MLLLTSFLHSPFPVISRPSNSVAVAYTDDGEPYGGRGGAVFNGGDSSTILFNRLALFKNNVGALVRINIIDPGYWTFFFIGAQLLVVVP